MRIYQKWSEFVSGKRADYFQSVVDKLFDRLLYKKLKAFQQWHHVVMELKLREEGSKIKKYLHSIATPIKQNETKQLIKKVKKFLIEIYFTRENTLLNKR
jgi:hypothetical protein